MVSCNCILLVAEAKYLDIILDFSPFLYLRSNLSKSYWLSLCNITTVLVLYIASSFTSYISLHKYQFLIGSQGRSHRNFMPTHSSLCPSLLFGIYSLVLIAIYHTAYFSCVPFILSMRTKIFVCLLL